MTGTRILSNEHHQIEDGIDAADHQSIEDNETVGKSLPNFPTVFRYLCVHFPYFSAALAAGHNLNIKKSINRAAMRTKEEKENVRIQEVQLYRKLL